ncbi:hypothetical protein FRC12_008242 [Ceratobasidium sp. 428]|nr:hypothetical protein FRC12_008242 [Ceratobasidium sp. 428]
MAGSPSSPPAIDITDADVPVPRPRRVQWASQTGAQSPPGHALDEHALDPTPFAQLRLALEEHRANPLDVAQPHTAPSTAPTSPTIDNDHRDLDLDVYIAPGETDGLPRADTAATVERRASRLVKAHQQGRFGGFLMRRRQKLKDEKTGEDVEKTANAPAPGNLAIGPGTGGGVLSSLLALYDHRNLRSGQSTPDHEEDDPFLKDHGRGKKRSREALAGYFQAHAGHRRIQSSSAAPALVPGPSDSSSSPTPNVSGTGTTPSPSAAFSLSLPKALKPSHRPAAARSAAGVFGGLIASTGNIAGAAAPAASTLGPEAKRPGYHLSRYSAEETPRAKHKTKLARTTSSSGATSPHSTSGGITPPHPPFATSDGGVTPLRIDTAAIGGGHTRSQSTSDLTTSNTVINSGAPLGLVNTTSTRTGGGPGTSSKRHSMTLGSLPLPGWATPGSWTPGRTTPGTDEGTPFVEWGKVVDGEEKRRRRRKEKKKRQEVYITMHVAEILQRHDFILKLARALMMFGAPSHRLEAQIQSTARVLDIQVSCMYLPSVMLLSFGDSATHTSDTKFLKQASALDLGKLLDAHRVYWRVIHDEIGVQEASLALDSLMRKKNLYNGWKTVLIGGFCSAFITPISFSGSFVDAVCAFPLGAILVWVQNMSARNELYSNVFEITIASLLSFISGAFAASQHVCYAAVASGSVVLILPGYIVLCGSLELASRSIISGSVRLCYSIIYSIFLGFGLSIGAEIFHAVSGQRVLGTTDYTCSMVHKPDGPWWQRDASPFWAFLCVPGFSLFLTLRNQSPVRRKELWIAVLISCAGWTTNHFATKAFPNRSDITSALGSLAVGLAGNLYGRFFSGTAFVVMITGILFQLPSGLSNGGLLSFASSNNEAGATYSYATGFQVAEQLVSVAVGLTVGLFCSAVLVHPFGGSRRRGGGLFSL